MPTVPTVDSFRATPTAAPNTNFRLLDMGDAGAQAKEMGQALGNASNVAAKIEIDQIQQVNQVRVTDAMNKAIQARLRLTYDQAEGFTNLRGDAALTRPGDKMLADEYGEKYQKQLDEISQSLGTDAQRMMFAEQSGKLAQQFQSSLVEHVAKESADYRNSVYEGTIQTGRDQMALAWGDPAALEQSRNAIKAAVYQQGQLKGLSGVQVEANMRSQLSPGHVSVIASAVDAGKLDYAREYMKQFGTELSSNDRLKIQSKLSEASISQEAESAADAVWATLGPTSENDAVKIFDMEKAMRESLKDNPEAMKRGITALRERASAFNAQQSEANAKAVNGVFSLIDSGASMSAVRRSDAWLSLPEQKRHDITRSLEAEAATREQRALAADQRALTRQTLNDKIMLRNNADNYLADSSPSVLASVSRVEVEALRTKYGLEATEHLLSKWDSIHGGGGKIDLTSAKMDEDTFKRIGKEFGYETYTPTGEEKKKLGDLKYRVERVIAAAQTKAGGKLSEEEKERVMRREFSDDATVTVDPGVFSGYKQVPIIGLDSSSAARVSIPRESRVTIAQKMAVRYQATQDPRFAPTEENLRYWYLKSKSPAADYIPEKE